MLKIEKIEHKGWPNCYRLSNPVVTMVVAADIGPRILYLGHMGGRNLFHEFPSEAGMTGGNEWRSYGGHRLWAAPEIPSITYFPDNQPVDVEIKADGMILTAEMEASTGLQKIIHIQMDPERAAIHLTHMLLNRSERTVRAAPWAITVMSPGGMAILPHNPFVPWPDSVAAQATLALWSYTDMSTQHWVWGERYILIRQLKNLHKPQKLGMSNDTGWAGYQLGQELFIKRFKKNEGKEYPDRNSNVEVWTNDQCLELETLGPLSDLNPERSACHKESWYLFHDVPLVQEEQDVEHNILPLLELTSPVDPQAG